MSRIVLFTSLQDHSYDPFQLADNFAREIFNENEMNIELTHLLLQSCGIGDRIPHALIANRSYDDIMDFFDSRLSQSSHKLVPLRDTKYFERFILFFERIISLNWNKFTNNGNFDGYLSALIEVLAQDEFPFLHVSCFAIKLKFITSYLKRDHQKQYVQSVQKYTKNILQEAIAYISFQCPLAALNELLEWIKLDASFAKDEYLRIITWSLKMDKLKLICSAFHTAYSLLNMSNFRANKLTLFVRKLTIIFEDLCFTSNNNIFFCICQCCVLLYKHYREALSQTFIDDLLDNLFAEDRERAKIAAMFWIKTVFEGKPPVYVIRKILKLLNNKTRLHAKILVDSLIDDCTMMTDWKLFVKMLTNVSRFSLNVNERHHVLLIMSYSVDETLTGFIPAYRHDKRKKPDASVYLQRATAFTKTMVPNLRSLFHLQYSDEVYAKTILLHMTTLFNFEILSEADSNTVTDECVKLLQQVDNPSATGVALDLFLLLLSKPQIYQSISPQSHVNLKDMIKSCKYEFEVLVNDFIAYPADFVNPDKLQEETIALILWRMYVLNRRLQMEKKYAFIVPCKILQHELVNDNPIFSYITCVCISLITEYMVTLTKKLKISSENDLVAPEEYEGDMIDIHFTIKWFTLRLKYWYFSDLSILIFFDLCEILMSIRKLKLHHNTWKHLLPVSAQHLITSYVRNIVCDMNGGFARKDVIPRTKTLIIESHLELMRLHILPLSHVYEFITYRSSMPEIMDEPVTNFILIACCEKPKEVIVNWLFTWLKGLSFLSHQDFLKIVQDFAEMIYPIKKKIQEIIFSVHLEGIEYFLSSTDANATSSEKELFMQILSELCVCLDVKNRKAIYEFFMEKRSNVDKQIWDHYLARLKKASKFEPPVPSTPMQLTSDAENCTPSPPRSNLPSSIQADESDLRSNFWSTPSSSERSLYVIRSMNDIHSRVSDAPAMLVHSRNVDRKSNVYGIRDGLNDIDEMTGISELPDDSDPSDVPEMPAQSQDTDQMTAMPQVHGTSNGTEGISSASEVFVKPLNNDQTGSEFELTTQPDDTAICGVIDEIKNFSFRTDSESDPSPIKKMRFSDTSNLSSL